MFKTLSKQRAAAQLSTSLARRRFVTGCAAMGGTVLLGQSHRALASQAIDTTTDGRVPPDTSSGTAELSHAMGHTGQLHIDAVPVNFTGHPAQAIAVNGSVPGPTLRWRQGQTVELSVTNRLAQSTSVHWHGILLPYRMDGVPGISFAGIASGESFTYRFPVRQAGTYWYHSHSGLQEQQGLYGAIVIEPADGEPLAVDRDHVLLLSDWSDESPAAILKHLRQSSDYYNHQQPTVGALLRDMRSEGIGAALEKRRMWNQMRMSPVDFADVSAATYTYLVNGQTPVGNWTGIARKGERVRLRLINGSAATYFDLRIPGLKMTVVAADGQAVAPVQVDEIRLAVAETYDVIVTIPASRAYTVFAQSMDRSGYARATLAPETGMSAEVPALDPKQWLSMADMGMDHGAMDPAHMPQPGHGQPNMSHGAVQEDEAVPLGETQADPGRSRPDNAGVQPVGMDYSGMDYSGMDHSGMDHSGMDHSGMDHSGTDHSGIDHSGIDHSGTDQSGIDQSGMGHYHADRAAPVPAGATAANIHGKLMRRAAIDGHDLDHGASGGAATVQSAGEQQAFRQQATPDGGAAHADMHALPRARAATAKDSPGWRPSDHEGEPAPTTHRAAVSSDRHRHEATTAPDTSASVDMRVGNPSRALDDPGPRLRGNGRRVLTYADLHTLGGPLDTRAPSRELVLRLTGNMARFIWGFDGVKFADAAPLRFVPGERLRIVLINDTMMNHPIHLHGMFSEVEDEHGRFLVRKHTVNVQPAKQLAFCVSANEPGQWAFHCHLLYHMEGGMMRKVVVA